MKPFLYLLVCPFLVAQFSLAGQNMPGSSMQPKTQPGFVNLDKVDPNPAITFLLSCDPPFHLMGLYDPALPVSPDPAVFNDPLLKEELISNGFFGKDKEYGDVDHDGDIDILYLTNTNELWTILNTGSVTVPDYRAAAKIFTGLTGVFSFRLTDWFGDSINDLVVMADIAGTMTISLYLDIAAQIGSPVPDATLFDQTQYPINNAQLMEAGDIDGDHFPDILISGQGLPINGTAYFKNVGPGWAFPPAYEFVAPQTFENPLIPEVGLSFPCPELFDADCDGDLDLFISDPTWTFEGGGHMDYYENTGPESPFMFFTQIAPCPFGFDDIPLPNMDLSCDWVVTRIVDFFSGMDSLKRLPTIHVIPIHPMEICFTIAMYWRWIPLQQ
ncbi:MAG: hypothetical protein IPL92_05650 [Saprospiraceae bacterium]|nr:hypothetical protein [Candidatus Opimibacter iunctus]